MEVYRNNLYLKLIRKIYFVFIYKDVIKISLLDFYYNLEVMSVYLKYFRWRKIKSNKIFKLGIYSYRIFSELKVFVYFLDDNED